MPEVTYAMIFRSRGQSMKLHFVLRMANRSTPMKGTGRHRISLRILLFLFVSLTQSRATRSATLEDSARELAGKIAGQLPVRDAVSVEFRNLSSLAQTEITSIKQALEAELQNRGVDITPNAVSIVSVVATLSENVKGYMWSAEIHQGDVSQVVFLAVQKPAEDQLVPGLKSLVLHAEKFWEGPQQVLDAAVVQVSNMDKRLVLVVPDGLLVRDFEGGSMSKLPLDSTQSKLRDPDGALLALSPLSVLLEPNVCTVDLNPLGVGECHASPKLQMAPAIPGHGQTTEILSTCGPGSQILASGGGDYSQADTVQAFESLNGGFVSVSEEVSFPGPVSLHNAEIRSNPTAIVRNLHSGNYEAYRLSISCSQ